jgi:hypothetical protein
MNTNKEAENCWEFWDCKPEIRDACRSFKCDSGKECWYIVGSKADKKDQCPQIKNNFKYCRECSWYIKMHK